MLYSCISRRVIRRLQDDSHAPEPPLIPPPVARFDVYGFRFAIRGPAMEAIKGICQDFAFFAASEGDTTGIVILELFDHEAPRSGLPTGDAVVYTPRNVVYREEGRRFIDYHGRALGIQEER